MHEGGFQTQIGDVTVSLLTSSMRCWREAHDARRPPQPCLFGLLEAGECSILAPVLDSLFCFYEAALQRRVVLGTRECLSEDELLLLSLVDRPDACTAQLDCPRGAALGLNCALCSTRIMLSMVCGPNSIQ